MPGGGGSGRADRRVGWEQDSVRAEEEQQSDEGLSLSVDVFV
jgi:hypothetical protein